MTKLQSLLITIGASILFQVGGALVNTTIDDLMNWKVWLASLGVGALNAIGVAVIAWKTTSGLSLSKD